MKETIYTIPVNQAFETPSEICPFCYLYERLQDDELDIILGASMMEPDIRIETNKKGFCGTHYDMMFETRNRLGLGLMIESHLGVLGERLKTGGLFTKDPAAKPVATLEGLSCYICDRIDFSLSKMVHTALMLWARESDFKQKFNERKMFCLPHYNMLLKDAKSSLGKKLYLSFVEDIDKIQSTFLEEITTDISWFCKKFDYRYDKEPWHNSKDAVERAIKYLKGSMR